MIDKLTDTELCACYKQLMKKRYKQEPLQSIIPEYKGMVAWQSEQLIKIQLLDEFAIRFSRIVLK